MAVFNIDALRGKIALVTGAGSGIGAAIALALAQHGAHVYLTGRRLANLETIADQIQVSVGNRATALVADVTKDDDLKAVFKVIMEAKNGLDICVNCAGIMPAGAIGMLTTKGNQDIYATNVQGTIAVSQLAARLMMRVKRGSIINISSIVGTNGASGQSVYAASKAAVIGFTKAAAKELGASNIRVNAIAPGFIATDMTAGFSAMQQQKVIDNISLNRLGQTSDVANLALFLASDASAYLTGQVIGIDGGMIL